MAKNMKATLEVGVKTSGEAALKRLERWQIRMQLNSAAMAEKGAERQRKAAERLERFKIRTQLNSARLAQQAAARELAAQQKLASQAAKLEAMRATATARAANARATAAEKAAARERSAAEKLERWKTRMQLQSARMAASTPRLLGGTKDDPMGGGGGRRGMGIGGAFGGLLSLGSKFALTGWMIASTFRTIKGAAEMALGPVVGFQAAMAQVRIKGGFDSTTTARLAEQAKGLARAPGSMYGPTEAARAQIALAASGLSEQQIAANTPTALMFAQAADMDTDEASDLLVNVARQFQMDLSDPNTLKRVGDSMIKGANLSTINVRDLQQTLKYAGPIAQKAGYGVEQAVAMAAITGNSGIKGSQSGTGLRNLFSSFAKPKGGDATAGLLKEIGLTKEDVTNGLEDIPTFLEMMEEKMDRKGFSRQKRVALAASLFGQYGMTAQMVLQEAAGSTADNLVNGIKSMTQDILNASGEMYNAAQIRGNTLEGRSKRLGAKAELMGVTLGEKMAPHLERAMDNIIARVTAWEKSAGSDADIDMWISKIGEAANNAVLILDTLAKAVKFVNEWMKNFEAGWAILDSNKADNMEEGKGAQYPLSPAMQAMRDKIRLAENPDDETNPQHPINLAKTRSKGNNYKPDFDFLSSTVAEQPNMSMYPGDVSPSIVELKITTDKGTKATVTGIKAGATKPRVTTNVGGN